jgi:glycosyltransferase involved in cell wall biosynthesis
MISIVIPVYNNHAMTDECLASIAANTSDYEIIIVDNGSIPAVSVEFKSIRNEENKGFPVAVNQGIRAAKGDIIILLNNDVIVTPEWTERFVYHLDKYVIVAPLANYCAMLQQESAIATYHDEKSLYEAAKEWSQTHDREVEEVNYVIGFCMAFKKSLWEELGDFDESIWPCSGEEIDFCLKARHKGYPIAIARDVYVHHYGSQTFKAMEPEGLNYRDTCVRNDAHLKIKWGDGFWLKQRGEAPKLIEVENDGKVRLNLGCGMYPLPGFINVDSRKEVAADLFCDALALPYEENTVDEIYAGHLLEHLTWDEGQAALRHWHHVLKIGGTIMITVPDFDVLAKMYLENPTAKNMRKMNDYYIYSYVQESLHRYCYGPALLKAAITEAGFGGLEVVEHDHPYFTSPMKDQITFKGVK